MARIRTLKPEFFDSPSTAAADLAVRLTFMAMWNWADDSGHGTANLKELEAFCWPNDEVTELPRMGRGNSGDTPGSWRNFAEICGEVAKVFGVVFYRVRNRPYYWIPSFKQHQSKDFRPTSRYPLLEEGEIFDVTSGKTITPQPSQQASPGNSAPMRGNSGDASGTAALGTGEQGNRGTGEREAPDEPKPPTRKHLIRDDWAPNEAHISKAQENRIDLQAETDKFTSYCRANGKKYADFDQAFHLWLNKDWVKKTSTGLDPMKDW